MTLRLTITLRSSASSTETQSLTVSEAQYQTLLEELDYSYNGLERIITLRGTTDTCLTFPGSSVVVVKAVPSN